MIFRKWGIYCANLDRTIGSEQGKVRPVLIVSEDEINEFLNSVNITPLTSKKKSPTLYPNEVLLQNEQYGLASESILLCHQIRTLDKKRLSKYYGVVDDDVTKNQIISA